MFHFFEGVAPPASPPDESNTVWYNLDDGNMYMWCTSRARWETPYAFPVYHDRNGIIADDAMFNATTYQDGYITAGRRYYRYSGPCFFTRTTLAVHADGWTENLRLLGAFNNTQATMVTMDDPSATNIVTTSTPDIRYYDIDLYKDSTEGTSYILPGHFILLSLPNPQVSTPFSYWRITTYVQRYYE